MPRLPAVRPVPLPGTTGTTEASVLDTDAGVSATPTLLEQRFPFAELSEIAAADRRAIDHAYAAHRWWARRPPGLMRGILLAASLPANTTDSQFWERFESEAHALAGKTVLDPFAGGGSTLVEAARLGATACGFDVDPLATLITRHELDGCDEPSLRTYGTTLLAHLRDKTIEFYPNSRTWAPLHYFSIADVTCPGCETSSPMYRDLIVARDAGLLGGVTREAGLVAFCPECWKVHEFEDPNRRTMTCCGTTRKLNQGTFRAQRFHCPSCGQRSKHSDLSSGVAPRRLIAVEETNDKDYRRIRRPVLRDIDAQTLAEHRLKRDGSRLRLPTARLETKRVDARPVSFGIETARELFTSRQLLVFGEAFAWLDGRELPQAVNRAFTLALSNALTTNNRLCGYARDYGRISALFSVRSYSLPLLAVELNPLHPSAGRGTLARVFERLYRAAMPTTRRYVWDTKRGEPRATTTKYSLSGGNVINCGTITDKRFKQPLVDLCIFDPPYYDYIAYSELSEFHRAWLRGGARLGGAPLLPDVRDPIGSFAGYFGACLRAAVKTMRRSAPVAFTFHSAHADAWESVGRALDLGALRVTALWPVRADEHMGHHTNEGNCEWDIVVVCRAAAATHREFPHFTTDDWVSAVAPLEVSVADQRNMSFAIAMAARRWGRVSLPTQGGT